MNKLLKYALYMMGMLAGVLLLSSCMQKNVTIRDVAGSPVSSHAAGQLSDYLNEIYDHANFTVAEKNGDADIFLMLSEQAKDFQWVHLPEKEDSYMVKSQDGKLYFIASDARGLLNAVYAFLEAQGCGFYISGDVLPKPKNWKGFTGIEIIDEPLTGDRFLFNWHNFLSGCTGWNLEEWHQWIDQANKMRYNGIMVHAYGNNPMVSFEYLGEKKQTGYLNNTASGRDWGNQHVNDVRRFAGGEIFDAPVFGAKASMASEDNKEKEATELMQQVFRYAEQRGTKLIFALDFDTWMSNPQNIIEKLPKEAVFEIHGRLTPNPEHPEGYKYFRLVLKSLLEMYPEIDQLSVWHRRTTNNYSMGSIWMSFPFEKYPESWKKEYREKLKANPDIEDNQHAVGMFAYSKVVVAIQKARDELQPDLEISEGSWRFEYVPYADAFYPEDVPLLPLDWEVVFDTPEAKEILSNASNNREVYPIIWAHHDDHRYIGRPYTPWDNLSDRLKEINASGFGIIHWTTRPLDLYFTSSARQVWKRSENEPLQETLDRYVENIAGEASEALSRYYYQWITEGPIFGRETSNHFVDIGKQVSDRGLESWEEIRAKALKRLAYLNEISFTESNSFLEYQKGMEEFYISFAENQMLFQEAMDLIQNGDPEHAKGIIEKTNPDETIQKYINAIQNIGFTPGEKALVFSMNTRWKADYINIRQQLGLEPVRFRFEPTQHDPLAQGAGKYTYFIDDSYNWWRCLWKHELENESFQFRQEETFLEIKDEFVFELRSMHGQQIPGNNTVELEYIYEGQKQKTEVKDQAEIQIGGSDKVTVKCEEGRLIITLDPGSSPLGLCAIQINQEVW